MRVTHLLISYKICASSMKCAVLYVYKILTILNSNATSIFCLVGLRYRHNIIVLYGRHVIIGTVSSQLTLHGEGVTARMLMLILVQDKVGCLRLYCSTSSIKT